VQTSAKEQFAAIIGNLLEHYDKALFGLLAPFIAPLFFTTYEPITALILTYAILPLGLVARPLGALFFGWLGDSFGRHTALFYSLTGMASITCAMGFLPTASSVGNLAPLLLALARMLQNFFAAGEAPGAAIFILEQTQEKKKTVMSSLFDTSSLAGILLASALITLLSAYDMIEVGWRWLFWLGAASGFTGIFLRKNFSNSTQKVKKSIFKVVQKEKSALILIMIASGFSHVTYSLSFTLMNGFVPLISNLSATHVLEANTSLLILDMLLLPCFGYAAKHFGKEKIMILAATGSAISAIPLFLLLPSASALTIIAIRSIIIFFGVAFAAPYHAWAIQQVPEAERYTILSLGSALGSQLIGAPAAASSLYLYKVTGWIAAPGLYLLIAAAAALITLLYSQRKVAVNTVEC
jgi:MFS family permease